MAEFCAQCAQQHRQQTGLHGECRRGQVAHVVCEGCGVTVVDRWGQCVNPDHGHSVPVQTEAGWWERIRGWLGK